MANTWQLNLLKQGVEVWNEWKVKEENFEVESDLRGAELRGAKLSRVDLSYDDLIEACLSEADLSSACLEGTHLCRAELIGADLRGAELIGADLIGADLRGADLSRADLRGVEFIEADLSSAILHKADLSNADLSGADLSGADLSEADLSNVDLINAILAGANFSGSNFSEAIVGNTVFEKSNLSEAIGLENVVHYFPSTIGGDTIAQSKGKFAEVFLRGCGLSDADIENAKLSNPDLSNKEINKIQHRINSLRAIHTLQISPLFISYSHADKAIVDKFESHLNKKGVRFWHDIHDMKAGWIEKYIDRAISQNPTVLLVLSENSLCSNWVEHKVHMARSLEKAMERNVLCPIALDDSWKSSRWPRYIMEQIMEYNILDFTEWKDDVKFEKMFRTLIDGLELFYKG